MISSLDLVAQVAIEMHDGVIGGLTKERPLTSKQEAVTLRSTKFVTITPRSINGVGLVCILNNERKSE